MASRGKKTIWVSEQRTPHHLERSKLLLQAGFDVHFVRNSSELLLACEKSRPGTIIVDTLLDRAETQRIIALITSMPELNAARCVLSLTQPDPSSSQVAMASNFRDLIPWRIDSKSWVNRLQYAVASRAPEAPSALGALTMNLPAIIRLPGRLVWMNETHMRLECRGDFKPGTTLHLGGSVASALGVQHISLIIESIHKDRLRYRFSQAVVAQWGVPADQSERARALIRRIAVDHPHQRPRVFLAINNVSWRKQVVQTLSSHQYDVNVAMQRANMSHEFMYFSPDIVFFDDTVLSNLSDQEIQSMFERIASDIPLVIFGSPSLAESNRITSLLQGRPTYFESEPHFDALNEAVKKYKVRIHSSETLTSTKSVFFLSAHPWSSVELEVSARIRSLSPKGGSLALPFSIGKFTLARVESPLIKRAIGRTAFLKITSFQELPSTALQPQMIHESSFRFSDLDQEDTKKMALTLLSTATEFFVKQHGISATLSLGSTSSASALNQTTLSPVVNSMSVSPLSSPGSHQISMIDPIDEQLILPDWRQEDQDEAAKETRKNPSLPDQNDNLNDPKANTHSPERVRKKSRQLSDYFDPVLAKAIGLFIVAAIIMGFIIHAASNVDESFYKDNGKVYSEFFKRMRDPDYRTTTPNVTPSPSATDN